MIGVGIHENIILKNVEVVEKEGKTSIDFVLANAGSSASEDDSDPFGESVDENGMLITGGSGSTTIKVWPLNVPDDTDRDGNTKTVAKKIEEANNATKELQNMFTLFARCYVTSDKIKFERFRGIPLTKDNTHMILSNEILLTVTKNLANQFIEMCGEYFGNEDFKLRILLKRSSTKNHYPKFRDKLLQAFPFVERMEVPKEASKLAFTKYELQNKLNDGTPKTETDIEDAPVAPSTLFGGNPASSVDLSNSTDLN